MDRAPNGEGPVTAYAVSGPLKLEQLGRRLETENSADARERQAFPLLRQPLVVERRSATGGFLTPQRTKLLGEMYGSRAGAVAKLLAGFTMPVGQPDPLLGSFYSNIDPLRQVSLDYLIKRHCVPPLALTCDGDGEGMAIGEAMVEINDRDRFEFSDPPPGSDAVRALIIVARDESGSPLDLVAWAPRPDRLASYHGRAPVLGAQQLDEPHFDEPLLVHRDTLSWLQAGRRGVVIIDAARAWRMLHGETLAAVDIPHGLELRRALQPPSPRIVIPVLREAA